MSAPDRVVVWGNCQAAPVADLLRAPLAGVGLEVLDLPPVYLLTPAEVAQVHGLMTRTALLVSQPIRDEYRVPGCSTQRLAALLPPTGRLVTYPVTYYSGALPFQVTANGADGARVAAPLTEYHDLRLLAAAAQGGTAHDVLAGWPPPASGTALAGHAAGSLTELRRREQACDITVSDLLDDVRSMFTVNHPCNRVLVATAHRILAAVGVHVAIGTPEREYLGAIRTPVDPDEGWTIGGASVTWDTVIRAHLDWYRTRPDVVRDGLQRNAERLTLLDPA